METSKVIELAVSAFGLLLGLTYIMGGLIVNLKLSMYGITEYQIVKVKYLVVGITFLTNLTGILFLATIPAIFVAAADEWIERISIIVSLLASLCLLWLWGRPGTPKKGLFFFSGRFWIITGTVATIHPLMEFIKFIFTKNFTYGTGFSAALAVLPGTLAFISIVYFYSRHLYGKAAKVFGSYDHIGMGVPAEVKLACDKESMILLEKMGVPRCSEEISEPVLFLDETSSQYIIGISNNTDVKALKINKELVKAILYC